MLPRHSLYPWVGAHACLRGMTTMEVRALLSRNLEDHPFGLGSFVEAGVASTAGPTKALVESWFEAALGLIRVSDDFHV